MVTPRNPSSTNGAMDDRKSTLIALWFALGRCRIPLAIGMISLAGCTTAQPDGTVRRHYFPYAVVTTRPVGPDGPRITVREVRSYGLAFGSGSTLVGHGKEHQVILPPDGRMYLVVRTDEQFQQALKLIENHPELGLYATQNPNP